MIVFDLKCAAHQHVFEAWFGSSLAYEDQCERQLLACPICGDTAITKAVMAPRVAAKGNTRAPNAIALAKPSSPTAADAKALLAALAQSQAAMLAKSTWVGRTFDATARAMDAGEVDPASIYGEVTAAEAKALIEDGIAVMPLPLPITPPEQIN